MHVSLVCRYRDWLLLWVKWETGAGCSRLCGDKISLMFCCVAIDSWGRDWGGGQARVETRSWLRGYCRCPARDNVDLDQCGNWADGEGGNVWIHPDVKPVGFARVLLVVCRDTKESRMTAVACSSTLHELEAPGSVFKNNNRVITCSAFHYSILRIVSKSIHVETFFLMTE